MENLAFPGRQLHSLTLSARERNMMLFGHCNQLLELIFLKNLPLCFSSRLIAIQSPFRILPISCASFSKIAAQGARGGKWGQRVVQRERVQKWEPIISALRTSDYIIPPLVFIRNGG